MIQLSPFLSLMLCLLTFEISEDRDRKNFYTRGPWYTCLVMLIFHQKLVNFREGLLHFSHIDT